MSFKRNILVSYVTQIYVAIVGIAMLPLYLAHMGAEAYGLVGFFTMLQAWFNLFDLGLTPTIARETARLKGGRIDALSYRRLLRALQLVFVVIAICGGGAIFISSGAIATHWLNIKALSVEQVEFAIQLMGISAALRWMSGLYRGCISGAEQLVWLGAANACIATLRFVGVIPVLIWIGKSPETFFSYQMLIALIELTILATKVFYLSPKLMPDKKIGWSKASLFTPIRNVLRFSLSVAFSSSVWILVTQTDKLVLSKLLSLADYGYFSLAVMVASAVIMISGPISTPLLPRMARLQAEGDELNLVRLYRNSTQLVAAIAIPTCLILVVFAESLIWAWTGNQLIATQAAPVLRLYALGNGFLVFVGFPYYLQFAKGDLTLHMRGNVIFLILLIPSLVWATWKYGAFGAGLAWFGANALFFLAWIPIVHRRFVKGLHQQWLLQDLFPVLTVGVIVAFLVSVGPMPHESRIETAVYLILYGICSVAFCAMSSRVLRASLWNFRKLLKTV